MSEDLTESDRRRLLALVGSGLVTGLAGCAGGGDGGGGNGGNGGNGATATETETATATTTGTATGTGDGGGSDDTVPEEYRTATSIGGTERDPDALSSKEDVEYQSEPNSGQRCDECTFYIEDKNGDGMGACAIVEGLIDPEGWCVSYSAYQG